MQIGNKIEMEKLKRKVNRLSSAGDQVFKWMTGRQPILSTEFSLMWMILQFRSIGLGSNSNLAVHRAAETVQKDQMEQEKSTQQFFHKTKIQNFIQIS